MIKMYGIVTQKGEFIDTSKTLRGAKIYATKNQYPKIGMRLGYNVVSTWTKIKKTWIKEN